MTVISKSNVRYYTKRSDIMKENQIYSYCRISKKTQKIERQIKNISKAYPTAIIITEAFTGTKINRPEFTKLLKKLSPEIRLYLILYHE